MAKRFIFRLDTLLKLRKRKEDEQRRVVAERLRDVRRCQATITDLRCRISDALAGEREMRLRGSLSVTRVLAEQRWRAHLDRRLAASGQQLTTLEKAHRESQSVLAERSRDVKVLEKLREKRHQAHMMEQERIERIETEEVGMQMYVRDQRALGAAR
jgi:flagellar protein FliJ